VPGRFDLDVDGLAELLPGQPAYRARQLRAGLLRGLEPRDITELPASMRAALEAALPPGLVPVGERSGDGGRTIKWLWQLADGARVETVLMHYPQRSTVCVSTQAGCAMGCSFCATGQMGFVRSLGAGEIVEQVLRARRAAEPRRLSNVVFMGMGEPLANYDATWAAIRVLTGELGISARGVTVSTVGVVPGIRRMAGEALPVNLAVSLHAADDTLRDRLVPLNRRYPLSELMAACEHYRSVKRRRLSFEWALIDGVNDTAEQAAKLAALARRLGAHVNLIPLNATAGYAGTDTRPASAMELRQRLRDAGVAATVRANRGRDIDGACGQLAWTEGPRPSPGDPLTAIPAL